jgi:hypothetical protein
MIFYSGYSMHSEELLTSLSDFPFGDSGGSRDEYLIKSISGLINLIEMAAQKIGNFTSTFEAMGRFDFFDFLGLLLNFWAVILTVRSF